MSLFLLAGFLQISYASRGEASLEPASTRLLSAGGVVHQCRNVVQSTHTASDTIQALKKCIGLLKTFSKDSEEAKKETKHDSQKYSSDMKLLGSFLQSLKGQVAETYQAEEHQYNKLRSKQEKALAVGFIERHSKVSKTKHQQKHKAKRLKNSHGDPAGVRNPRDQTRHQKTHWAPSFIQISADEHEEFLKVDRDLAVLQETFKKQITTADQEAEDAEAAKGLLKTLSPASSLLQLSDGDGESQESKESDSLSSSSLLEEEAPGFASLFWKPWKLQDEKQTLHHIVGYGLTKDESAQVQKSKLT